jgi:hypothetical protein
MHLLNNLPTNCSEDLFVSLFVIICRCQVHVGPRLQVRLWLNLRWIEDSGYFHLWSLELRRHKIPREEKLQRQWCCAIVTMNGWIDKFTTNSNSLVSRESWSMNFVAELWWYCCWKCHDSRSKQYDAPIMTLGITLPRRHLDLANRELLSGFTPCTRTGRFISMWNRSFLGFMLCIALRFISYGYWLWLLLDTLICYY